MIKMKSDRKVVMVPNKFILQFINKYYYNFLHIFLYLARNS